MRTSVLRLRANFSTLDHKKCHNCKIRAFSHNTNPPNPSNEDKKKQYLHRIPPWMKKNTNSKETPKEKEKLSEKGEEVKVITIKRTQDQTDKYKSYFQTKPKDPTEIPTPENENKSIKYESATSKLMKKEKVLDIQDVSISNKFQPKGNKLQALCTSLKTVKKDADKTAKEISTSGTGIQSRMIGEKLSKVGHRNTTNIFLKTMTFDCRNDIKSITDNTSKSANKGVGQEIHKANKTTKKGTVNEELAQPDVMWAKEKIDELRKIDPEPIFFNKSDFTSLKQKTEALDSESKVTPILASMTDGEQSHRKSVEEKIEKFQTKRTKPAGKTFEEMKEQVVVKLTSNPLKLNSKETLYGNQKINKEKMKNIYPKTDSTGLRTQTNVKNRIKLTSQKPNLIRNQNINSRQNLVHKNAKTEQLNQNLANKKQLLRDLSVRKKIKMKPKVDNNSKLNRISRTKQFHLNSNTQQSVRAPNTKARPEIRSGQSTKRPIDNMHNLDQLTLTRAAGVSGQSNVQQAWYKELKQVQAKPAVKTMNKPSNSKKPIFKSVKPLTVGYPDHKKQTVKNKPTFSLKKQKPVFGPPTGKGGCNDDCGNDDGKPPPCPIPVCVLNSDTCISDDLEKQRAADEAAAKKCNKEEECFPLCSSHQDSLAQLLDFLGTCKCLLIYYFKRMINLNFYLGPKLVDPKDNSNVSVLVTNNIKQPIYINDSCPYVKKSPTIYQKLQKRIDNFAHLIKTKETIEKSRIHGVCQTSRTSSPQPKENVAKSSEDNGAVIMSSYPKKSYSEILTNLLSAHTQRTQKM